MGEREGGGERERGIQPSLITESSARQSGKTQRTKAVQAVLSRAVRRVLLTGTPAVSRPIELFTQATTPPPAFPPYPPPRRYLGGGIA